MHSRLNDPMAFLTMKPLSDRVWYWRRVSTGGVYEFAGGGAALLIDSGAEQGAADGLRALIERRRWERVFLINTHYHPDHIFGNRALLSLEQISLVRVDGGQPRLDARTPAAHDARSSIRRERAFQIFQILRQGLTVIPLPGHSPDSVAIGVEGVLFVGDALFAPPVMRRYPVPAHLDPGAALRSLQALRDHLTAPNKVAATHAAVPWRWVVAGHGEPLTRDEAIRAVEQNEQAIITAKRTLHSLAGAADAADWRARTAAWLETLQMRLPSDPAQWRYWQRIAQAYAEASA